jgi:hypothetical protein
MKPKIFLRKLLRGGDNIEDVFNIKSLSIIDEGVENKYISNIDLNNDEFTFNEAYINTYYLHLSIFCYYYINKNSNSDRADFITKSVDKIKDYVKCYVLYTILREIIGNSDDDRKIKLINAIKSTDAFDDFNNKQVVVSVKDKSFENMKKLLSAIAIIIKYRNIDILQLIAALRDFCSNFNAFLIDQSSSLVTLNELLLDSQQSKTSYEKTAKSSENKMQIFDEIKKEVQAKLHQYKSRFLTEMKKKAEYDLITKAKIANIKNKAVQVIRIIVGKYNSDQITNIVQNAINVIDTDNEQQIGKDELSDLRTEFNKLSDEQKNDPAMIIIRNLFDDESSSEDFSSYYYEEYLKEEFINNYAVTGGKKRKLKKRGGTTVLAVFNNILSGIGSGIFSFLQQLTTITEDSVVDKKDIDEMAVLKRSLDDNIPKLESMQLQLSPEQLQQLRILIEMKDLTDILVKQYRLAPRNRDLIVINGTAKNLLYKLQEGQLQQQALESSDLPLQLGYLPIPLRIEDDKLKSIIKELSNPHDDLIKAIQGNRSNLSALIKKERELNAKNDAIIRFLYDSDDVELPTGLKKDNMIKMKRTTHLYEDIMRDNDLQIVDIDMIYDDLKSMAANIKSVLAILKRLSSEDILVFIDKNVDEAALIQLRQNVRRKLSSEITDYDKLENEELRKQLEGYEEILKSARSVTDLAQKIIDDNKKGGFFSYKIKGGNQEELLRLTERFAEHQKNISDEISKLESGIAETTKLIKTYNENKDILGKKSESEDVDQTILSLEANINDAIKNKQKSIEELTKRQDEEISRIEQSLVSYRESKGSEIEGLKTERDHLIREIKKKVAEIKELKTTTKKSIDDASGILTEKNKIIDILLQEKRTELEKINEIIQKTDLELINKQQQTESEERRIKEALEEKNQKITEITTELFSLKQQKNELTTDIAYAESANQKSREDMVQLKKTIDQFKDKLDKVESREILREYPLNDEEINEILKDESTSVPKEPEVTSVVSPQQSQYNRELLNIFYRVQRFIDRNTDDDFKDGVEFLKKFNNATADIKALVEEFNSKVGSDSFYPYGENKQLIDSLAVMIDGILINITSGRAERYKSNDIKSSDYSLVTITVDKVTLTFIKIDNFLLYVKFGESNVYLKLRQFDFEFHFDDDDDDSNKSKLQITLTKPPGYNEFSNYTSGDKYYYYYKAYLKRPYTGLFPDRNEITLFINFLNELKQQVSLEATKKLISNARAGKNTNINKIADESLKNSLLSKLGNMIWFDGTYATNLYDNNRKQLDYTTTSYRKTDFLIDKSSNNKIIGVKFSLLEQKNKIYVLFDKPLKFDFKYVDLDMKGGAANTDDPNNIFNAYIISFMNKVMEMNETDLKDFTTKAMIAVQA